MKFVIYEVETSAIVEHPKTSTRYYRYEKTAKAAITRIRRDFPSHRLSSTPLKIADTDTYYESIEKTEMVRNIMNGKLVEQSVNTPRCCDVSSELYWSM